MAGRVVETDDEVSEINVTPFIDVMLVLLIVFMVAAPLSTVDVQISLPGVTAAPTDRPAEPLWLTVTANHVVHLGVDTVEVTALAATLDLNTQTNRDTPIFLRADQSVDYGVLMGVLDALRAGGYLKVALVGLEASP